MKYVVNVLILTLLLNVVCAVRHPLGLNIFGLHKLPPPTPRRDAGRILEDWFDQKLDHYDPTITTTWKQRYHINSNYYRPGGPVFLFISGEWEAHPFWVQGGFMMDLVAEHTGLAFQLEHRFYGESRPTENLSVSNLRYLRTDEALADLAYFIQAMNKEHGLHDARWIVFGGSYAGSLAAWMRIKYPHIVLGAVASSAPTLAQTNFAGYYEVVGSVMRRSNPPCYDEVNNATQQLHNLLQSQAGAEKVRELFNLCRSLDISRVNDVYALQSGYASLFASAVQYDTYTASDTSQLCKILHDDKYGATLLERYANLGVGEYCNNVNFDSYEYYYGDEAWGIYSESRAWFYQTCTECGYYQTTDSPNQPFTHGFPLSFFLSFCTSLFGERFNEELVNQGVNRTNMLYGGLHPEVRNVVFTHGTADPWHVLGILEDLSPSAQAILIKDFSHCIDLRSPHIDDPPQMKAAHEKISHLVREWLQ